MPLVSLVYASRLSDTCSFRDLYGILKEARTHNADHGVTGILCHDDVHFLQLLEGPREVVNALYRSISMDDRHVEPVILECRDILARDLSSWSMAYSAAEDVETRLLLKYSPTGLFLPMDMPGESARQFLIELAVERQEFLGGTVAIDS